MQPESRSEVNFACRCGYRWAAEPGRIEDRPDRPWHPYAYYRVCPVCEREAGQAGWEVGLMAAAGRQTGPRTPAGIAAVSKNLEGHPTPEEAQRTRFNALRHGLSARTATYYPAKPGGYPHCNGCQYREDCEWGQGACLRRTELFMRHHIAFETGDPKMLMDIRADTQAMVQAIIDDMLLAIVADGVRLKAPKMYYDKDGCCHVFKYTDADTNEEKIIYEHSANPLLKPLFEALRSNSLSLADQGMTPKVQDDQALEMGHILADGAKKETLDDFMAAQNKQLADLSEMIKRSREKTEKDPILIEYNRTGKESP